MAQRGQKDLLTRLADAGEEALSRLAGTPGADRVMGVMTNMRDQMDALSSRVRGIDDLERRVAELERQVARLSSASATGSTRRTTSSTRKSTSSSKRKTSATTRKKPE